jgi:hypothetical protein
MREEQEKVVAQLQTFVSLLANDVVKNDFQIAVVTTGISQYTTTCDLQGPNDLTVFERESGRLQHGLLPSDQSPILSSGAMEGSQEAWLERVKLLLTQGIDGSGQEMGLEAARRAVSEPLLSIRPDAEPSGNRGFLRPGSRLLVVILSDEDDCSVSQPEAIALEPTCGSGCAADSDCNEEGTYCLLRSPSDASQGRACSRNACETPAGRELLVPVSSYVDFFKGLGDGSGRGREVFLAVIGAVDSEGRPARCQSGTDEAYGVATRYAQAVDSMAENGLIASICDASYGATLSRIAELVRAPHTLQLPKDIPDGHLLVIELTRADGSLKRCVMGEGFEYSPASEGVPARATLLGDCRLRSGDRIKLKVACAG